LHIGQEDLLKFNLNKNRAIKIIKEKIGNKILGLSTHNLDEILEANNFNIDYIGLGAFRDSKTKKDISSIGGEKLLEIAKFSNKKVAIIGGVKLSDSFKNYPQISYKVIGSDLMREFNTLGMDL
jgi:thiamine-phosphate pyrophosphorylase